MLREIHESPEDGSEDEAASEWYAERERALVIKGTEVFAATDETTVAARAWTIAKVMAETLSAVQKSPGADGQTLPFRGLKKGLDHERNALGQGTEGWGEACAKVVLRQHGWTELHVGKYAYDFDMVAFDPSTNELVVIEAKGPGAEPSTTKRGLTQGTAAYIRNVARVMTRSKDPVKRAIGRQVEQALDNHNLRSYVVTGVRVSSLSEDEKADVLARGGGGEDVLGQGFDTDTGDGGFTLEACVMPWERLY